VLGAPCSTAATGSPATHGWVRFAVRAPRSGPGQRRPLDAPTRRGFSGSDPQRSTVSCRTRAAIGCAVEYIGSCLCLEAFCIASAWGCPALPAARMTESDIRAAGLRCTPQRIAVLEVLRSQRLHYQVDEVSSLARERLGTVSTQGVYDALNALVEAGLARRIKPAGSAALYEARAGDNHHHLVCRGCGRVTDVDCAVGSAACLQPSDSQGFVIDEAEITFWGWCPECARTMQ
jgi:Fe2+ or Zn2+ uptake regulation protein